MPVIFKASGTVTQYNAAIGTSGHSWQTVSRSNNTWYQNTTGHPIQIAIGLYTSKEIWIGTSTSSYIQVVGTGSDPSESMNEAIIPDDHYYKTNGYRDWTEMR